MEIYIKDKDGKLQETNLYNLLDKTFYNAGFKMDSGRLGDGSCAWVGVVQESEDMQVLTNIEFDDDDRNCISDLHIYLTPIKRIVDEDNSKQIV